MRFSRILVPTDFSTGAENAAAVAVELARAVGGSVLLFHAFNPPSLMLPDGSTFGPTPAELVEANDRADRAVAEARDALVRRIGKTPKIEVRTAIGDAGDEILRIADSGRYDVVVMGTHGRTGIRRLMLGSVAEKVLRRAAIPVLTVREPDASDRLESASSSAAK